MQNGCHDLLHTRNNIDNNSFQCNLKEKEKQRVRVRWKIFVFLTRKYTPTLVLFWIDFSSHKTQMLLTNLSDM